MPLFRREHKKTVDGANAKDSPDDNGTTTSTTTTKATNTTTKTASTPSPQKATSPDKASPASRRTVTKPTPKDVTTPQKATQVLYRLNYAVKQRPTEPRRSTELIPLNREFDDMRKQLKALVTAARKYQQSMEELSKCRSEVLVKTAKMTENSPLHDAIASHKVVLGESLVTLGKKLSTSDTENVSKYQTTVLDYLVEWELIVTQKVDSEVKYTQKLHKNLNHYEAKLEKLRKTVATKEEKGKVSPQLKEKLERNEEKLTSSWKEYEETATKTCHLLEEATKMGWKDLYPFVQALLAFEGQCNEASYALWSRAVTSLQNKVSAVVDAHDRPLPASAFTEVVVLTRPNHSRDSSDEEDSPLDGSEAEDEDKE